MEKILITEAMEDIGPELLRQAGFTVVYADGDMETVRREIIDAAGVFVRVVKIDAELLALAKDLKVVCKHGVGVDNIDRDYCRAHGITVCNVPGGNAQSVAEYALALMMALSKRLIQVSGGYRKDGFHAKDGITNAELEGKTVALIGLGNIGGRLAAMCRNAFGMRVLAYDPFIKNKPEGIELFDDVDAMLKEADFVSLHAVLTDSTRKMINKERIAEMKAGAILINCARGPMVDEKALLEALRSGHLAGAGLDVTDPEPMDPEDPLFHMPNVIVTPHFANQSKEAAIRVSELGARSIIAVLNGEEPMNRLV